MLRGNYPPRPPVLLKSRTHPPATHNLTMLNLEEAGAQVAVVQADVSQKEQTAQVLAEISETMPPVRGIIHLAGVLDDIIVGYFVLFPSK